MGIPWYLKREYTPFIHQSFDNPIFESVVNSFSSTVKDEYNIEGEMGMPLPPFVARFSRSLLYGNLLGTADEDGHVMLLDTRKSKDSSNVKEWSAHSNAVFDLAWIENEAKMITASGDQTARLWDVEKAETISIFKGHTCSLKTVAVAPHSKEIFVTGARDGKIMVWDTRCNRKNGYNNPINTIAGAHVLPIKETTTLSGKKRRSRRTSMYQADAKASVTSAIFLGSKVVVSSGACDGSLKFWDLRKTYTNQKSEPIALHTIPFPGVSSRTHGGSSFKGYSSLVINSTMSRLYAVCTNDTIYEYSTTNYPSSPLTVYQGHLVSSFYVKAAVSPDDRFLLCGSSDGHAYIWRTDKPSLPWMLKGHSGEVTSVTWSPHQGDKIVTCSDDNSFRIWRKFQNPSINKTDIPGICERKTNMEGDQDKDNLYKNTTTFYKPSKICTNIKATVRWVIQPTTKKLNKISTPVCKTPDISILNDSRNTPSSYTNVTPKAPSSSKSTTPSVKKIASSTPTPSSSSARRKLQPTTPKTSRSFLETWLNSPKNVSLDDKDAESPTERLNPIVEVNEDAENIQCENHTSQTTSDKLKDSNDNNTEYKAPISYNNTPPLKADNKTKNSSSAAAANSNGRVIKRRLISKYGRNKTQINTTPKSENIKTLLLSGSSKKRKRDSEDGENSENYYNGKCAKTLKLDAIEIDGDSTKDFDDVFEIAPEEQPYHKNVLSENTVVKDLLDIAEGSG